MDRRLRRHEPDRAAVRARAREERHDRRRLGVPLRVHVLLSPARPARGVDHDDDDAGARARRVRQRDLAGLRVPVPLGLRYLVVLDASRRRSLFVVLAQPMLGVLVRGGFRRTTPRSPPTRCRRSRSGSCRSPCTSTRCAASTRCRTRARRSRSTRSRTASTSCSRSRCSRHSACRDSRSAWSGAYTVAAVVALVVLRPPRRRRAVDRAAVGRSALRAASAPSCSRSLPRRSRARSGTTPPADALVATAVAGARRRRCLRRACWSSLRRRRAGRARAIARRRRRPTRRDR